jgi:hypothetical protein
VAVSKPRRFAVAETRFPAKIRSAFLVSQEAVCVLCLSPARLSEADLSRVRKPHKLKLNPQVVAVCTVNRKWEAASWEAIKCFVVYSWRLGPHDLSWSGKESFLSNTVLIRPDWLEGSHKRARRAAGSWKL